MKVTRIAAGAALLASLSVERAAAGTTTYPVTLPAVVAVPQDAPGHPIDASAFQVVPFDLASVGYEETEYFLRGNARIYGFRNDLNPFDESVRVLRSNPYVDRILVRKPIDPARFSGNVVVELLNDALTADLQTTWTQARNQFVRNGDGWIGITTSPTAIATAQKFEPARYAPLSFASNDTSRNAQNCPLAANTTTETGILFDVITQVGTLVRGGGATSPFAGYDVRAILLNGYSLGALQVSTYVNAVLPTVPRNPFDAFVASAGAFPYIINSCANYLTDVLRPYPPAPRPQPVVQTQTYSELALGNAPPLLSYLLPLPLLDLSLPTFPKRADSDAPTDRYRYYEVAGTAHAGQELLNGIPNDNDVQAAVGTTIEAALGGCHLPGEFTTFPDHVVYDAIWANVEAWVRNGTPPPHARLLGGTDFLGNRLGGVRSTAVDVPVKSYKPGVLLPVLAQSAGVILPCSLFGYDNPLGAATLRVLYPTHAAYANAVAADAARLVQQRFLAPYDANQLVADAWAAPVP